MYIYIQIYVSLLSLLFQWSSQAKEDIELWASLEIEGPTANAWYGRRLYTVPLPPDGWEDIQALLAACYWSSHHPIHPIIPEIFHETSYLGDPWRAGNLRNGAFEVGLPIKMMGDVGWGDGFMVALRRIFFGEDRNPHIWWGGVHRQIDMKWIWNGSVRWSNSNHLFTLGNGHQSASRVNIDPFQRFPGPDGWSYPHFAMAWPWHIFCLFVQKWASIPTYTDLQQLWNYHNLVDFRVCAILR